MDALLLSSDVPLKAAVVTAMLCADYLGTYAGVRLSARRIAADLHLKLTGEAHPDAPAPGNGSEAT